jgi:hypothetical protein
VVKNSQLIDIAFCHIYLQSVTVQNIRSHSTTMRAITLIVLIAVTLFGRTPLHGFTVSTKTAHTYSIRRSYFAVYPSYVSSSQFVLQAAPEDSDKQEEKLAQLGYSSDDIERSRKENDKEPVSVNVNLLPDIDPVTLTAIGFALIAFNFFVLGNMGDGGISGVVARIINLSNS